jgi:thiol-disulfide isomerase/thioredoxin
MNFWATWCAPCVEEMPALDALEAARGGEDFRVVTVSIDRGGVYDVEPFFERHGLEHLQPYFDPAGRAPAAFGLRALPTTLVIDRAGRWVGSFTGPADWAGEDALRLVDWYLAAPAPAPETQPENPPAPETDTETEAQNPRESET